MIARAAFTLALVLTGLLATPLLGSADPSVVLSTSYPAVIADKGREITFPVSVVNRTAAFQEVDLRIAEGPADWKPDLRASGFSVRRVMLEPSRSLSIDFIATPPESAPAGEHSFLLRASSAGTTVSELRLTVTLRNAVSSGLALSTRFPNVQGQAGASFSFSFDLTNQAGIERDIGLGASAARGWQVTFAPSGEAKQVSSLRVKAGATQGVEVTVTAPSKVDPADYEVVVTATAGSDKAQAPLRITILGKTAVSFDTKDGKLNASASIDQDTKIAFILKNSGSAPLQNVTFSSSPPQGWNVTFQPEKVDALARDQQVDVTAVVRPGPRALAGDYMVTLSASAGTASASQNIRVTVETPTSWGLVAILAILAVLGGLGYVFVRYSRR